MSTFRLACPECRARLVVEAQPRERATHDYPGSDATIYAEGCVHAETLDEEWLWEQFNERFHPERYEGD